MSRAAAKLPAKDGDLLSLESLYAAAIRLSTEPPGPSPGGFSLHKLLGPGLGPCYLLFMRVIALSTLKAFLDRSASHADAREPVMAWYRSVKRADWTSPSDVKRAVRSASILQDGRAVFNIAGNKYRIVVWINYPYRVVYIRFIGSHRQYDKIDAQTI